MNFLSKTYTLDKTPIFFKELKVKHLKTIYKSLLGDEVDKDILIYNINNILKDITDTDVLNISFIDYFILLLETRISSIGNTIKIQVKENTTIDINLVEVLKILQNLQVVELLQPSNFQDQLKVYYRFPTILEITNLLENQDKITHYFLDKIEIQETTFILKDSPAIESVLNKIPAKTFASINKKIQTIITFFNSINLLSYNPNIKEPQLYFNLNIKNLCLLVKLLFGDHLMSLYENIFALCKLGNFTPEYIENCSPGEYLLFVKKLEEINRPKNNPQESHSLAPDLYGDSVIDDEPLNPYESPNLPPITSQFHG